MDKPDKQRQIDEWLTAKECALRLGISERTVQRRIKSLNAADIRRQAVGPVRVRFDALCELLEGTTATQSDSERQSPAVLVGPDVTHLLAEIEWLRRQNEALLRQNETLTVTLGQVTQRIEAKETAGEEKPAETGAQGQESVSWWRRLWRR